MTQDLKTGLTNVQTILIFNHVSIQALSKQSHMNTHSIYDLQNMIIKYGLVDEKWKLFYESPIRDMDISQPWQVKNVKKDGKGRY